MLMRQARAQEGALLERMTQMGQALQSFSTDATLNESQRREQEHVIANLQTYANNLRTAGQELERQHQQVLTTAEARVQSMLAEATANYTAVEKRAIEAEENLRRLELRSLESERTVRSQWDQLAANQEAAERDHRRVEQTLRAEIQDMKEN